MNDVDRKEREVFSLFSMQNRICSTAGFPGMNKKSAGWFTKQVVLSIACIMTIACSTGMKSPQPELKTVPSVDIRKYAGVWYEIARFPHRFQEGCYGSKATYTLLKNGKIRVLNECRKGGPGGKRITAKGKAWVVDKGSNAKLKVSFFWPFSGHYWIIDLGEEYDYAVVGHPKRKYLWILSRTEQMDEQLYAQIVERLKTQQYDTARLIKTSAVKERQ